VTHASGVALAVFAAILVLGVTGLGAPTTRETTPPALVPTNAATLVVNATALPSDGDCSTGAVDVTFVANVTGGSPPYSANWQFPDGTNASGLRVVHHFSTWLPSLNATVTVSDASGQTVRSSVPIIILWPPCATQSGGLGWTEIGGELLFAFAVVLSGIAVVVIAVVAYRQRRPKGPGPPTP
jgi:hypothetical protein